jgi:hypothetical protein
MDFNEAIDTSTPFTQLDSWVAIKVRNISYLFTPSIDSSFLLTM